MLQTRQDMETAVLEVAAMARAGMDREEWLGFSTNHRTKHIS